MVNFLNITGRITNAMGMALLKCQSSSNETITYKVFDSTNAQIYSGIMQELPGSGLYYKFLSMSSNRQDIYLVVYYLNDVAIEFDQILNQILETLSATTKLLFCMLTEDIVSCKIEENHCFCLLTELNYFASLSETNTGCILMENKYYSKLEE